MRANTLPRALLAVFESCLLTARVTDRTCVIRGLVRQSVSTTPRARPLFGRSLPRSRAVAAESSSSPPREGRCGRGVVARVRCGRETARDPRRAFVSSRALGGCRRVVPRNKRSQRRRGIASESDATARTPCRRWKCGFGWWRASTSVRARFPPRRSRDRAIHRPRRSLARSRDYDDVDVLASRERERRARIRVVVALLFPTPRVCASPPPPPLSSFLRARVAKRPPRAQPTPPSDRRRAQDR